eukprot:15478033-Alexandrium_andersonii.AAC.1
MTGAQRGPSRTSSARREQPGPRGSQARGQRLNPRRRWTWCHEGARCPSSLRSFWSLETLGHSRRRGQETEPAADRAPAAGSGGEQPARA